LTTRAGIWRFSATRTGQRFDPAARYATGIRNAGALAIDPADGALYATQHGRDQLAENWPKLYDWKQSAELPAEELLLVVKGGDYGWPYCYYDPQREKLVQAPEYGGDGEKVGECAGKLGPAAAVPAHRAPNALAV
jgi:glucose/arabinose dehydrogenase